MTACRPEWLATAAMRRVTIPGFIVSIGMTILWADFGFADRATRKTRGKVWVAGSARTLWNAQIDGNMAKSCLDDATGEESVRAIQGERAPQAHGYLMILFRRHADRDVPKMSCLLWKMSETRGIFHKRFSSNIYTGLSSFRFQSSVSTRANGYRAGAVVPRI